MRTSIEQQVGVAIVRSRSVRTGRTALCHTLQGTHPPPHLRPIR